MDKSLWCSDSSFTKLKVNEKSENYTLGSGESQVFRFFVGAEAHCHPLIVSVRPLYGNHFSFLSSTIPISNWSNYQASGSLWRENTYNTGQTYYIVCPHWNGYTTGTYSLSVTALETASFYIEIAISPDAYPLNPPPMHIPCDSVSIDVGENEKAICLEDGKTTHLVTAQVFFLSHLFSHSFSDLNFF